MSRRKKVHRKMARDYSKRQSMRYKLADGLFLYFPPLTKEQQSERQRTNCLNNKHDYPSSMAKFTREQRSIWTKKQWRENKKYRELMYANTSRWAKMATPHITENHISRRGGQPNGLKLLRTVGEVNRLIDKYHLGITKISPSNPRTQKELDELYYALKTLE